MKRYTITADYNVAGYSTTAEEDSKGEWVKWEDVRSMNEDTVSDYADGGFLIPNNVLIFKTGLCAKIYRVLGKLFGSSGIYSMGVLMRNFREDLLSCLEKKHVGDKIEK